MRGSYGTAPKEGTRGGNWSHTPEIVDMVQDALKIFDPDQLEDTWYNVNKRLREEHYEMGIGYVHVQWGVGPRIKSWTPLPLAFYPSAYHTIVLADQP